MDPAVVDRATHQEVEGAYEVRLFGWTEERYWLEAPQDHFCEFVDGVVVMHSPVDVCHVGAVGLLTFLLRGFCRHRGAGRVLTGPAALQLRPGLAREPDLFVVSPADAAALEGCRTQAIPLLVIEVAGAGSEQRDLVEKAAEYAARGIPEYWVVLLERRQVVVHRTGSAGREPLPELVGAGRLGSRSLPGFFVDVEWLWAPEATDEIACLKAILGVDTL